MRWLLDRVSVSGIAVIVFAVVTLGWVGYELSQWPPPPPDSAATATPNDTGRGGGPSGAPAQRPSGSSSEPSAEPASPSPPLRVALLSDGLAIDDGSWFDRTIAAREVEGAVPGVIASQAGLGASQLEARAALASQADVLVVQAGTIDLVAGGTAKTAGDALEGLLQTALDLGGPAGGPSVVWVPVPPLNAAPAGVLEVNDRVREFAGGNDIVVWDLTSPVATPTGAWRPGLSVDGIAPNDAGQAAQARAAVAAAEETLPDLAAR